MTTDPQPNCRPPHCWTFSDAMHARHFIILAPLLAAIVMLAACATPSATRRAESESCGNYMCSICIGAREWAMENNAGDGTPVTAANITPLLGRGTGSIASVFCPADPARAFASSYNLADSATKPACKIVPATHVIN